MKSKLLKMVLVLLVVAMPMDVKAPSTGGVVAVLTTSVVTVGLAALVLSGMGSSEHGSDLESHRIIRAQIINVLESNKGLLGKIKNLMSITDSVEVRKILHELRELLEQPSKTEKQIKVLQDALSQLALEDRPVETIIIVLKARSALETKLNSLFKEGAFDKQDTIKEQLDIFDNITKAAFMGAFKKKGDQQSTAEQEYLKMYKLIHTKATEKDIEDALKSFNADKDDLAKQEYLKIYKQMYPNATKEDIENDFNKFNAEKDRLYKSSLETKAIPTPHVVEAPGEQPKGRESITHIPTSGDGGDIPVEHEEPVRD